MARKKTNKIIVRLSDEDYGKYLEMFAFSKCRTQQEYIEKCILQKDIVVINGLIDVASQLRKIGININQYTKLANELKHTDSDTTQSLKVLLKSCFDVLNEALKNTKGG